MEVVDLTSSPPPSPGRASETAQPQEVDGVVMLNSDEPAAGADKENTPARPDAGADLIRSSLQWTKTTLARAHGHVDAGSP